MREDSSRSRKNKYGDFHSALINSYGELAGLRHFIGCSREEQSQRTKLLEELAKCEDAQKTWLYLEDYFELLKLSRQNFADESWWQNFVTSPNKRRLEELALQFLRQNINLPTELKGYASSSKLKKIVQNEKERSLTKDIENWFGNAVTFYPRVTPTDSFHIVCTLSKLEDSEIYTPILKFCVKHLKSPYSERTLEELRDIITRRSHEKEIFPEEDWRLLTWIHELSRREEKSEESDTSLCKNPDSKHEYLPSPRFFHQLLVEWGESGLLYLSCDSSAENSPEEYPVYYHNNFAATDIKVIRAQGRTKKGFSNLRSHLYFHLSTDEEIELSDAKILDGHPAFILYQNQFFLLKGISNTSSLSAHIQNPLLPLKCFNQSFVLNLARRNCRTDIPWNEVCISHKAKPRLILELFGDSIQAKIEAISERDKSIWFWNGQSWEITAGRTIEGRKRSIDKDVLEYLDDERLDSITEWFHRFDWFSVEKGVWRTEADINFLQKMAVNWKSKPEDAEYLGNPPIQRLFLNGQKLKPKVVVSGSGIDWLSVCAEWESEGLRLSRADLQRLCSAKGGYVKLPDAGWVELDEESVLEAQEAMASLGVDDFSSNPQRVEMLHALHLSEQTLNSLTGNGVSSLRESIKEFKGIPHVEIPSGIHANLREYQQNGFNFLCWLAKMGVGGILADDMGLGKTLQTLAWLLWLKHNQPAEKESMPSLVVCPASVVYNWKREVEKFTPDLSTLILESGERKALFSKLQNYDLIVINYNLLRRDLERLVKFHFKAIVLDEAQYIKNPSSQVAHAVKQLRACYRLALTGTPLENRLLDIWSITDFVQPGYLGSQQKFLQRYGGECVIPHHSEPKTQNSELTGLTFSPEITDDAVSSEQSQNKKKEQISQGRMSQLSARLRPILLRRLKSEVARDLPERIDLRCDCPFSEEQRKLYLAELRRSRELINESVEKVGLNKSKIHVLAALMRLRQICCHPSLVGSDIASGKTEALFDLLETLHSEGQKVLVFSQFVEMLNILQAECEKREYKTYILTGATKKRENVVNAFQECEDPAVFLLSLRAAGTGLNLTAASYVVLYDPWWNPAVEAQAIDRTHRIGQMKSVHAYRLIAPGTVEEKIWELQQMKSSTIDQVLGDRDFTKKLTQEDLQYLFSE